MIWYPIRQLKQWYRLVNTHLVNRHRFHPRLMCQAFVHRFTVPYWRKTLRRICLIGVGMVMVTVLGMTPVVGWSLRTSGVSAASSSDVIHADDGIGHISDARTDAIDATGRSLFEQGWQEFESGDLEAAISLWQQAANAPAIAQDIPLYATVLNHLAIAHQRLGQWSEATASIDAGIQALDQATATPSQQTSASVAERSSSSSGSPEIIQARARLFNTRGRLEWFLGQPEAALETWQQATAMYRQINDQEGIIGSQINQVQALETLGYYRQACDTALTALNQETGCDGLDVASAEQLRSLLTQIDAQANSQLKILGLRSLGNVLRLIGQLDFAQQVLRQGLEHSSALPPQQRALTLLSLGTTQRDQYMQAKILYDRTKLSADLALTAQLAAQTLATYDQVIAQRQNDTDPLLITQAQLQRLTLLIDVESWNQQAQQTRNVRPLLPPASISEWPTAATQVTATLDTLPSFLPPTRLSVDAYLEFAQQLLRLQTIQPDQDWLTVAQTLAMEGVTQAEQLRDSRSRSYAYGILGQVYEAQGDTAKQTEQWLQAQASTVNALGLAQSAQIPEITYRWQWQLGRLAQKQQRTEEAIAYYEAAVQTLDRVRDNLLSIEADVQFSFLDDVEPVYRGLVELLLSQNDGTPSQAVLRQAIRDIDALQLSELENFLGCNLTESVALSETPVDPTAVIIYPIILKQHLAVITKFPQTDELHFHAIPLDQETLTTKLVTLRRELARPYRSRSGLRLSQELYDWLIRPIEPLLDDAGAETLVFVLDGKFRNIPMATLHDGENYVVKRYALALTPGLQLLEPQALSDKSLDVLTFGLSQMRKQFPPHNGFEDLSNVEAEVNEIKNQLPSRLFLNQDFTQTTLAERIRSVTAPIVHLATHGQFSSEPTDTFVLAWDQRIDINALSAILRARNADTNPIELLVLSACKTADGDDRAALGLAGIAVRSGARSTLASLWTVDDKATADMMSQFYRELASASTPIAKAEALRRAQLTLLDSDVYNAPRYWAPFILVGNWL